MHGLALLGAAVLKIAKTKSSRTALLPRAPMAAEQDDADALSHRAPLNTRASSLPRFSPLRGHAVVVVERVNTCDRIPRGIIDVKTGFVIRKSKCLIPGAHVSYAMRPGRHHDRPNGQGGRAKVVYSQNRNGSAQKKKLLFCVVSSEVGFGAQYSYR